MGAVGQRGGRAIGERPDHQLLPVLVDQLLAVGRPTGEAVVDAVVDDLLVIGTVGIHQGDGRGRQARRAEVAAHRQRDFVAGGRPHRVERAIAFALEQRHDAAAVGVHDFDPGVGRIQSVAGLRAIEELFAIGRERRKRLVQKQLEVGIVAHGRHHALERCGRQDLVVDHLRAVGGPCRAAHRAFDDLHHVAVRVEHLQALGIGSTARHVTDLALGQKHGSELGLIRLRVALLHARLDVDGSDFDARGVILRHVGAQFVGFVIEDPLAVGRPRGATRDAAHAREAAQAGSVGMNDVDAGGLHVLPMQRDRAGIVIAIRGEGDPPAVRGPGRAEIAAVVAGQVLVFFRGDVEQPDVRVPVAARGHEGERVAVRRERGLVVARRVVGELLEARAVGMHAVDVGLAHFLRRERHPLAVARQSRG